MSTGSSDTLELERQELSRKIAENRRQEREEFEEGIREIERRQITRPLLTELIMWFRALLRRRST